MPVVLVRPEIATNTGNIIRLCANTGTRLHLVEPLGFSMDDRSLRRAGLDYHELADVHVHADLTACRAALGGGARYAFSSRALRRYTEVTFADDAVFVFGAEQSGLTSADTDALAPIEALVLPMVPGNRSLNLANAVAAVVYEAWRQQGFDGAAEPLVPLPGAGLTGESLLASPYDR